MSDSEIVPNRLDFRSAPCTLARRYSLNAARATLFHFAHEDRLPDAFPYFLTSALIDPGVVEAWSNALGAALVSDEYVSLLLDVVGAAYQRNGLAFEREIHRVAFSQGEGFDADGFIESIQEVIAMLPEEREGFTLRMLGPGAEYDELEINRRDPDDNAS